MDLGVSGGGLVLMFLACLQGLCNTVTEDLVRYMASASKDNTFLVDDPVWAEDFAPNGKSLAQNMEASAYTTCQVHSSNSERRSQGSDMPSE